MAKILLLCFIFTLVFISSAAANGQVESSPTVPTTAELETHHISDPPTSSVSESRGQEGELGIAEAPEIRRLGKHHHSTDKSVAGGGVIIGGLATAIFATIFAYIRVTRRSQDNNQTTT